MKHHLRVTFHNQSYFGEDGGYVYLETLDRPGILGQQILDRGHNCMTTPSSTDLLLRKLHLAYRRNKLSIL